MNPKIHSTILAIATALISWASVNLGRLTVPDTAAGPLDLAGWVGGPGIVGLIGAVFAAYKSATGGVGDPTPPVDPNSQAGKNRTSADIVQQLVAAGFHVAAMALINEVQPGSGRGLSQGSSAQAGGGRAVSSPTPGAPMVPVTTPFPTPGGS